MSDPADLANLNDIVLPAPIPWWPPAPGWWIAGIACACALLLLGLKWRADWRANAYRRAALAALDAIGPVTGPPEMLAVSAILKRAALVAYPREQVASLTGQAWLEFLDRSGRTDVFAALPASLPDGAAYASAPVDGAALATAARRWLRAHRRER